MLGRIRCVLNILAPRGANQDGRVLLWDVVVWTKNADVVFQHALHSKVLSDVCQDVILEPGQSLD